MPSPRRSSWTYTRRRCCACAGMCRSCWVSTRHGQSAFGRNRIEVLSAITELRQICCHPSLCLDSYEGSSGKLELLMDILPTALENGHRVLLFSQFTSMLNIIRNRLTEEGIGWLYLDGQTPAEERISFG